MTTCLITFELKRILSREGIVGRIPKKQDFVISVSTLGEIDLMIKFFRAPKRPRIVIKKDGFFAFIYRNERIRVTVKIPITSSTTDTRNKRIFIFGGGEIT